MSLYPWGTANSSRSLYPGLTQQSRTAPGCAADHLPSAPRGQRSNTRCVRGWGRAELTLVLLLTTLNVAHTWLSQNAFLVKQKNLTLPTG